jgi:hypothetical protein
MTFDTEWRELEVVGSNCRVLLRRTSILATLMNDMEWEANEDGALREAK